MLALCSSQSTALSEDNYSGNSCKCAQYVGNPMCLEKRATKYKSLLRKMTYKDKGSGNPDAVWHSLETYQYRHFAAVHLLLALHMNTSSVRWMDTQIYTIYREFWCIFRGFWHSLVYLFTHIYWHFTALYLQLSSWIDIQGVLMNMQNIEEMLTPYKM